MTQTQYDQAHEAAIEAVSLYLSGLLLLCEFQDRIEAITAPRPVPHETGNALIDPATGLRI
jgi:hypothetical protein